MIRTLLAVAALLLTACTSGAPGAGGDGSGNGSGNGYSAGRSTSLPAVTLPGFEGGDAVDLATLRGPAVINLWASWCGPCRTEMPVLQEFHEEHGDRVRMLGIDFQDTQSAKAAELVEETGVTYDLVVDEQGVINGQGAFPVIRGLPFLAFVDETGAVTHVEASVVESVDELVADVDQHLGVAL